MGQSLPMEIRHAKGKRVAFVMAASRLANWIEHVNEPLTKGELEAIRRSIRRGRPLGDSEWTEKIARRLGLETTLRPRGRPKELDNGS